MSEGMRNKILAYLSGFYEQNGYSPSYREIAEGIGVKSTSTIHKYVYALQREGLLDTDRQRSRAVSLTRRVNLSAGDPGYHRIRLRAADGGTLFLDCAMENNGGQIELSFGGIMDATLMKGNVSRIVGCSLDTGD